MVYDFSPATESTEQAYAHVTTATLEEAKQVAYRLYMLEDENLRNLHNLIVKNEFPDGWIFALEAKDPDHFTVPNSFLVLGKDGSTEWILPEDESAITNANSVKECLELWGKGLLDETERKHGSSSELAGDVVGFLQKYFNEEDPSERVEDRGFAYYINTQPSEALNHPDDVSKRTIGNGPLVILKDSGKVYSFSSNPEHMFGSDGSHVGVNTAKTIDEFNTAFRNLAAQPEPIAKL